MFIASLNYNTSRNILVVRPTKARLAATIKTWIESGIGSNWNIAQYDSTGMYDSSGNVAETLSFESRVFDYYDVAF